MNAKTIKGASASETQTSLSESMEDGFKPTLAIVFISIKQDRKAIIDILSNHHIDVIGATSSGEFINGHQSEGEIVVLLMDMHKDHYRIVFEDIGQKSVEESTNHMVEQAFQTFKKPAFILVSTLLRSDGVFLDGEGIVNYMEKIAGPEITMFGGMAGNDISFTGTWVFTNDKSTDYGMAALILNEEEIALQGLAFSGWKPMGDSRTVTKSEGNSIYTIDNRPALEIYMRLLGYNASTLEDQINFFDTVGVHYPFQVERENREPKMCNPVGYDSEKQALVCESDVPQGAQIRFSTPPDFDIIETVIEKANDLKTERDVEADALLIFSCAGRLSALGPMAQEENEGLQKLFDAPMAGFYTYGEFGKGMNGKHEFHSTTCSWVTLKEKNKN